MADVSPNLTPRDLAQSRFRLPHWGWFLLATIVLLLGFVGLSIWLPWHREQAVIHEIERWGGNVRTENVPPRWLRRLDSHNRASTFNIFPRAVEVFLFVDKLTDVKISYLCRLKEIRVLWLINTYVTDDQTDELLEALLYCGIRH